jgi:hypothetical protein
LAKSLQGEEHKLATEAKIAVGDYNEKEFIVLKENDPISEDGAIVGRKALMLVSDSNDSRYGNPPNMWIRKRH